MKGFWATRFAFVAVAALGLVSVGLAGFEPAEWQYFAEVTMPEPAEEAKGLVEVSLPPEVLDLTQPSLADLRVIDAEGREVPCVLRRTRTEYEKVWLSATVYNRTFEPGKSSSVTVDLGGKVLKDRIHVRTSGANFRREVLIESSDDGVSWRRVREGALLFRIGGASRIEFEREEVTFPRNDQRYLRVTVFNSAEDDEKVAIEEIRVPSVSESGERPARTALVPIKDVTVSEKEKATLLEFDLGFRNLPLRRMELAFDDSNFFRRASLEGRQQETVVVRHRVEDGPEIEKVEEAPWRYVKSFVVFRYSAGGNGDSSLEVPLAGVGYRYLRVKIENDGDTPLTFKEAKVDRYVQLAQFSYQPARGYRLFFGSAGGSAPKYDLSHYVERLESEGIVKAGVGAVAENPAYAEAEEVAPWSERHRAILWAALIVIGVVLALMIARQARSIPKEGKG